MFWLSPSQSHMAREVKLKPSASVTLDTADASRITSSAG
jgi:hypothetical protein